ncbi:hypothetical protein NQ314_016536 [Rhamnusium bicolor]|uniref:DDE Tnp4 domain-containing protein n=1 Tax=Rhamnusium bicolor TaxID=1586634 RepID=A0AAV8WWP1_9CUCU|nr:hypothetical protein NQ314_016536 [Rhamnusium bicolor]
MRIPKPREQERLLFNLQNISDVDIEVNFRFHRDDLPRLLRVLQITPIVRTKEGDLATGEEALCILLRRLAYPNHLKDLKAVFSRSSEAISHIVNFMTEFIYQHHGQLLDNLENLLWLDEEKMQLYGQGIAAKGAAVQNCFGFIDGTARPICRPSQNQEEYYSGHKRQHCVKYQSVLSPDGIILNIQGSYPGRRHDAVFQNGSRFVLFGDQAYGIRELLLCPYPGRGVNEAQRTFNASMSVVRQAVEWGFQKVLAQFAFTDFKKNQKLLLQDLESMYKTAIILTNCHTCLYSSQTAQYFLIEPPQLEQYFNIN